MKKLLSILLAAILCAAAFTALAGTSVGNQSSSANIDTELHNVYDFKFDVRKNGIGCGVCPVYTAPSESSFRGANGKACVDTSGDRVDVAGFDNGWLLVRYETNSGYRVGYIPPKYVKNFSTTMAFRFSHIRQQAVDRIALTDNPMDAYSAFAYLEPGESYDILAKYTYYGNWWYIECEVDGQRARGFISRDTTRVDTGNGNFTTDLGNPLHAPSGNTQIGTVRLNKDDCIVRAKADPSSGMVARVHLYDQYPAYGVKTGTTGKDWYYIYVDGVWGWISCGMCTLTK